MFDDGPMRVNPTSHGGATAEPVGTARLAELGRGLGGEGGREMKDGSGKRKVLRMRVES